MPATRSRTKAFEENGALDFEFYLADRLKIGTVYELRQRMSSLEFRQWYIWHARRAQKMELERLKRG